MNSVVRFHFIQTRLKVDTKSYITSSCLIHLEIETSFVEFTVDCDIIQLNGTTIPHYPKLVERYIWTL